MALQVWIPFDGNTVQKGLSNVTMAGSPNAWVDGKIGKCARFDGNVSNVIYNNTTDFNYTDNFSWTIWVKTNYTGTTAQFVFTNGRADAGAYGYGLQVSNATTCGVRFGSAGYSVAVTGGEWTHLAFTKKGNDIKIYKNGVVYITSTFTQTLPTYTDGNGLGLGCFHYISGNIYPYYGDINDFRIYDHTLSPKEVKEISKGLVLHYPLSRDGFGVDNLIPNYDTSFSSYNDGPISLFTNQMNGGTQEIVSNINGNTVKCLHLHSNSGGSNRQYNTLSVYSGKQYTISCDYYSPVAQSSTAFRTELNGGNYTWAGQSVAYTTPGAWKRLSITLNPLTSDAILYYFVYCDSGTDCYVKNIKIEEGATATPWTPHSSNAIYSAMGLDDNIEYDVSGFGNNGTKYGTFSYSSDTPRYNASTVFNGTNWVAAGQIFLRDELTYSWWGYVDNWATTHGGAMMCSVEGGGMGQQNAGAAYLWLICGTGTTSNNYGNGYDMPQPSAGWHMFTETWDGYSFKVYLDGVLKFTDNRYSTKTPVFYNSSYNALFIGGECSASLTTPADHFVGKISDARVYATALSADDVLALYQTPISLANNGVLLTGEIVE